MQKLKRICVLVLSALLILGCSFSSYADVNDLLISTDSNALMTMELDDDDYGISTFSSLGTVTNTVDWSDDVLVRFALRHEDTGGRVYAWRSATEILDNGYRIVYSAPNNYYVTHINFYNISEHSGYVNSPKPGVYTMQFDASSAFSYDLKGNVMIGSQYEVENANLIEVLNALPFQQSSGDVFVGPVDIKITSGLHRMSIYWQFADPVYNIDYSISQSFVLTADSDDAIVTAKPDVSSDQNTENYQNDVSSSLSDLSSSVDDIGEGISGITDAIENLQGAMEPHYSNVLTQLHHITEQLHAFYDQIYNNIHLKEYALWQDIKTAIENMDLEVVVELDELKQSINNMSTAVQNKLQAVQDGINNKLQDTTDQITGGYDNAGMESDKDRLDSTLQEYDDVEQNLVSDATDNIEDFVFDLDLSEFLGPLQDISYMLQGIFVTMGPMNVAVSFSLMLSVALVLIGWYRFKGGA